MKIFHEFKSPKNKSTILGTFNQAFSSYTRYDKFQSSRSEASSEGSNSSGNSRRNSDALSNGVKDDLRKRCRNSKQRFLENSLVQRK